MFAFTWLYKLEKVNWTKNQLQAYTNKLTVWRVKIWQLRPKFVKMTMFWGREWQLCLITAKNN